MKIEHWIYTLPLRIRSLFRRKQVERDLTEELRYHVEQLTDEHIARGMSQAAARTAALQAMGGMERRKEEIRQTRQVEWVENLRRDIRYTLRMLRRTPSFTVIAVTTLAVGIGANAAIFTVVNAVLLRPLAYGDPGQLTVIQCRKQETVAPGAALYWKAQAHTFQSIGAAQSSSPTLTGRGDPEQLRGLRLTGDVLPLLQVSPLLGRMLLPEEMHAGHEHVVVISYDFWRRRLGADPRVLGQTLTLDGAAHTIVGVMPSSFQFAPFWMTHAEVFRPLVLDGGENDFDGASLRVFGRMRAGVTVTQAQAEMAAIAARIKHDHPDYDADVTVVPLQEKVVGSVASTLLVLLAAVALVLLIACANVTHLQLMRASSREREIAVRLSMGASRGRLLQQALTESLILSLLGGMVGLVLAVSGVHLLVTLAPRDLPRADTIRMDPLVFIFMLAIAGVAGLVSGIIPALATTRVDPNHTLKESGRGSSDGRRSRRTGSLLIVSEFAMAIILLVGAGLVLRSVGAMLGVDTGFDAHNVLSVQVAVRGTQHDTLPLRGMFYTSVVDRIKALPGVEAVSATNHLPLHGDVWRLGFNIDGRPLARAKDQPRAIFRIVRPGYFNTMRIPILRGRDVTTEDMVNRSHVVLLDESAARSNWPGTDPVGQRISVNDPATAPEWFTVIGVVKDVRQVDWSAEHKGEMYYPYWNSAGAEPQDGFVTLLHPAYMTVVVRTRGNPLLLRRAITGAIHELDADAPLAEVLTMDQVMAEQVSAPKFYLILLSGFAVAALLLAAVGVYGVISHTVAIRTREIGIRLALGAERGAPFRLIVQQGLKLALAGSAVGVIGALLLTRYLRSLLFEVGIADPITFVAVPVLLIGVAIVACYFPARRASRVEPMVALRGE